MRTLAFAALALFIPALASAQPARRAPGFSLPDVNNQFHDPQDYRGKVLLVDIMRSDCPECKPFSQKLEEILKHYGDKVAVLAITNPPDNRARIMQFIAEQKVTYPILFDCGQVAYSFVRPNPMRPSINIPHIYVVDPQGYIRNDFEFSSENQDLFLGNGLYKHIDPLLKPTPKKK
jgi:peroxiredoxin